jgi:outer membrane usher protein
VLDSTGATIGVVGQGSQVYARVPAEQGTLTVKWSQRREDQCSINYDIKGLDVRAPLLHLDAPCTPIRAAASAAATAPELRHGELQ